MINVLIICVSLFLIVLSVGIGLGIIYFKKYLDSKKDNSVREYYSSLDINDDKISLLDKLIDIEFENYIKFHPDKFDITGESYIKEAEFQSIIADITAKTMLRLTPAVRENVKLVYVINGEEDYIKIIGEKVGLSLAIAASEINTALIDDSNANLTNLNI